MRNCIYPVVGGNFHKNKLVMKGKFKKIALRTIYSSVALLFLIAIMFLNPQFLFAEKKVYKTYTIYSNDVLPDNYLATLDYAIEIVKTSEIYEPNHRFDLFICNESFYNDIDSKLLGQAQARCVHNNILLKGPVDFENNTLIAWNSKRNLKRTIAHEAMHFYQMKKIGILQFNPLVHPPIWKVEGYPEYIAYSDERKSDRYDLKESLSRIIEFEKTGEFWFASEPGQLDPLVYYKGRIMMEYLIDIKGLTYSDILKDSVTDDIVFSEMISWVNK